MLTPLIEHLIPSSRRQARLLQRGERFEATIVGIRRRSGGDSSDRWEFALDVETPDGARRVGVRQKGIDQSGSARLGTRVPVRTDGRRTIIDLAPGSVYADWKSLKEPPAEGVRDDLIDVAKGEPLTVQVLSWEPSVMLGVRTQNLDIAVRAPDGSENVAKREIVPRYAAHLLEEGAVVPAVLHRGKLRLDWAAGATAAG